MCEIVDEVVDGNFDEKLDFTKPITYWKPKPDHDKIKTGAGFEKYNIIFCRHPSDPNMDWEELKVKDGQVIIFPRGDTEFKIVKKPKPPRKKWFGIF